MRNTGLIIAVVVLVALVVLLFGGMGMMGFGNFGMGPGMMNGGMMGRAYNPLGGIFSLVVWAAVIIGTALVAVLLIRSNNIATSPTPPRQETPLDILKARYARGEITPEQYAQMKKELEG